VSQRIANISATPSLVRRLTAMLALGAMLTLILASGSPIVHDCLHANSGDDADHQCAVVLFASGVTLAPGATELSREEICCRTRPVVALEEIFLVSPRYLRQPERGPPVS
jgi:hypothetical protein